MRTSASASRSGAYRAPSSSLFCSGGLPIRLHSPPLPPWEVRGVSFTFSGRPASAEECAGLLAATIAGMVAIVGDADPMEPFQRVRIGVTDAVGAHPDQEVVAIREDVAGPVDHAVVRRVVPGAVVPLAS